MLDDQEAVVSLLQDGHELEDREGAAHIQHGDVSVQPAEDAGVVAADEEGLVALQFRVAVDDASQDLAEDGYRGGPGRGVRDGGEVERKRGVRD